MNGYYDIEQEKLNIINSIYTTLKQLENYKNKVLLQMGHSGDMRVCLHLLIQSDLDKSFLSITSNQSIEY